MREIRKRRSSSPAGLRSKGVVVGRFVWSVKMRQWFAAAVAVSVVSGEGVVVGLFMTS